MANAPSKNVKSVTRWTPNPSPVGEENLSDYLYSELNRLSDTLINIDLNRIEETHTDPASSDGKPRSGDIRYADGTNWDPLGEGKGLYIYDGSAWKNLVNQDISSITISSGNSITIQSGGSLTVDSGATITNNGTNGGGFGKVLQVVTVDKSDTYSLGTTGTWTDITGLSVAITPSSTSNKILVGINLSIGYSVASTNMFRITRDGTAISVGDSDGSRRQATVGWYPGVNSYAVHGNLSYNYLDSPSTTSSVTYKVQANIESATFYLNRSGRDSDSTSQDGRRTSNIVLMEIEG